MFLLIVVLCVYISHTSSHNLVLWYLRSIGKVTRKLTDPILAFTGKRIYTYLVFAALMSVLAFILSSLTGTAEFFTETVIALSANLIALGFCAMSSHVNVEDWDSLQPFVKNVLVYVWLSSVAFRTLVILDGLHLFPVALFGVAVVSAIPGIFLFPIPPKQTVTSPSILGAGA